MPYEMFRTMISAALHEGKPGVLVYELHDTDVTRRNDSSSVITVTTSKIVAQIAIVVTTIVPDRYFVIFRSGPKPR